MTNSLKLVLLLCAITVCSPGARSRSASFGSYSEPESLSSGSEASAYESTIDSQVDQDGNAPVNFALENGFLHIVASAGQVGKRASVT